MTWRKLALAALLATCAGSGSALAQALNYNSASSTNVAGTFADLGTTGSAVALDNLDDATSTPQPIGFSFNFNGQTFTQLQVNTNGWLKLGTVAPSNDVGSIEYTSQNIITSTDTDDQNILSVFGADLLGTAAAGSEVRMVTTGTAPNRVCTVQWKNMSEYPVLASGAAPQYGSFSFQAKLYETSNNIEFVYGPATPGTTGAAANKNANVGLKGSGPSNNQLVLATKAATAAWSAATFVNAPYASGQSFGFTRTVVPDLGRTLRFAPGQAIANDAGVQIIYSMAKVARTAGSPHTVQAIIRNQGSNAQSNLGVRLTVSGATTYTNNKSILSLPVGGSATVTFDAYPLANLGTNTLTVSLLLGDDDPSNDSKTFSQEVTDNAMSVAPGGPPASAVGFESGPTASASAFAVKYTTTATRTVTGITTYIYSDPQANAVGKTVYAAVLSRTGAVLGRTPDYVVTAADANTRKTFTFASPVTVPAGDFLAAFVQMNAANGDDYFPVGTQEEEPTRPGTFFTISSFSPTSGGNPTDAASGNFGQYMIEAVLNVTTGVSKALDNAVALYPNPSSNGEVTLQVSGAQAAGLQVEITNTLGQRVYTGTARDNFRNQLNLSHLANGMYVLKLKAGDQYMLRNLSIQR
ncbi:hypothetical protein GCM10027048_22730 [Hymenobacter coalescens]